MTTITIKVQGKKEAQMLYEVLRSMKFVKEIGINGGLTEEQIMILEERMNDYKKNPKSGIPWEKIKAEAKKKLRSTIPTMYP
jgi:hypothetical protein